MKPETLNVEIEQRPPIGWGSDAIAELLDRLGFPYIAMVPGSSYRGLHDSLVNYLGNRGPQMIVCLHEEHTVAIAQGFAKVTGQPMLVGLHSNVGLMHATMAVYNAYCDRSPMVLLGATGPVDAAKRRPWIDWVHTAADQGSLVRDFVKWDDQPGSVEAALDSLVRGSVLTRTQPSAPVYICLDCELQEDEVDPGIEIPNPARYPVPVPPAPDAATVADIADRIGRAARPLVLLGRTGRGEAEWQRRIDMVEALGVCVLTDMRMAPAFPTTHPNHPAHSGAGRLSTTGADLIRRSDLILALDWTEVEGTMRAAFPDGDRPYLVNCRNMNALLNGWVKDQFTQVAADVEITATADQMVDALLAAAGTRDRPDRPDWPPTYAVTVAERPDVVGDQILMPDLASALRSAADGGEICYTTLPLGWSGEDAVFEHPLDYLGRDGGGGVGSGPGIAVGAALALDGSGRLPVAVIGDGDYLMGSSALWSAAHYRLPLLVVVANNRSYYNDEKHQEQVASRRSRPVENRTVGQHLRDPDPDIATIARGLGLSAYGPVIEPDELGVTVSKALQEVRDGGTVVVDVRVNPHGYGRA